MRKCEGAKVGTGGGRGRVRGGAAIFGRTVLGGMNQRGPLTNNSRELIQQEVHDVLDEFGAVRFILGAGCAVSDDARPESFAVARDAALDWCQRHRWEGA